MEMLIISILLVACVAMLEYTLRREHDRSYHRRVTVLLRGHRRRTHYCLRHDMRKEQV